jgi:YgiT-type zinc finger domain-containing protein
MMKCAICKSGMTQPGHATVTLTRGTLTLVVRGVPANVCDTCGEEYVPDDVARGLLSVAEEALAAGVQVDVRDYVAA